MISSIAKHFFIGAFLAIFIALVTIACVLAYGIANAPWNFNLTFQSVEVLVFIVTANGAFEFRLGAGTIQAFGGLILFCGLSSFITETIARHRAKKMAAHPLL